MARYLLPKLNSIICLASYLAVVGMVTVSWGQTPELNAKASVESFFVEQVLPILESRCLPCHSHGREMEGELALDFASGWKTGGSRGAAVVPGNPEESLLLQVIDGRHSELVMPPEEKLSNEEVTVLRTWIEQGAFDSRTAIPQSISDGPWWSLESIAHSMPPLRKTSDESLSNPIDAFIAQRLEGAGLSANNLADRRALLRRVTVDLHGMLPTLDELLAFEKDASPDAYERVVDRLLASPRYGERWARHWLDWVHFADSHGFEHDVMRMHAWRYRDHVIRSLNDDVAWPEWVQQQIAADVLFPDKPELTPALGFLASGPWDQSTAATAQTTFDYIDRDDIVTLAMSVLTSSTVHCSRCHNHKFDPIPQRDYYALQAVFAGVGRGNVSFDPDPKVAKERSEAEQWKRAADARDRERLLGPKATTMVAAWEQSYRVASTEWTPIKVDMVLANEGTQLITTADGLVIAHGPRPATETTTVIGTSSLARMSAIRLDVYRDDSLPTGGPGRNDNGNFHLSDIVVEHFPAGTNTPVPVTLAKTTSDFDQDSWTSAHAIDGDTKTAWGIYPQVNKDHAAAFALENELQLQPGDRLAIRLRQLHGGFHTIGRFRLSASDSANPLLGLLPHEVADALRVEATQRTEDQRLAIAAYVAREHAEQVLRGLPSPALVYAASPKFEPLPQSDFYRQWTAPKRVFVLKRGNIDTPAEEACPGGMSCLKLAGNEFELNPLSSDAERRRAFALWVTHPENPLFWRSMVNRLWLHHFGQGIVDTPNDFGRMGSLPSHPELLDWLAVEFRRSGGSIKHMHRLMVTSDAYQRASQSADSAQRIDPENRLLWRGTRRRLDAETFRDSLMRLAETLDLEIGGPAVQWFRLGPAIQVTPSVDYSNFDWSKREGNRRAIYRFVYRGQQDPFMEALDFPDAAQLTPSRTLTASALQALALWNHDFVLYACERLAERLNRETRGDLVGEAFETLYLREPSMEERKFAEQHVKEYAFASLLRILINSSEFLFLD